MTDPQRVWDALYAAIWEHEDLWAQIAQHLGSPGERRLMQRFVAAWDPVLRERMLIGPQLYGTPAQNAERVRRLAKALDAARNRASAIRLPLPPFRKDRDFLWLDIAHPPKIG